VVEHIRYNASDNPLIEKDFISHLNSSQAEFQIIVLRGLGQIKVENFNRITKLITDGQIAAIAKVNDLILVTRNTSDYKNFDAVTVQNWHIQY